MDERFSMSVDELLDSIRDQGTKGANSARAASET